MRLPTDPLACLRRESPVISLFNPQRNVLLCSFGSREKKIQGIVTIPFDLVVFTIVVFSIITL